MFIDTHTHIYLEKFDEDRDTCIKLAIDAGVEKLYLPNIDISTIEQIKHCVEKYPNQCIPMLGLHPCSVSGNYQKDLKILEEELDANPYVAVGEIGLDYYWSKDLIAEQKIAFQKQIEWASSRALPIVIHSRDSLDDCIAMVKECKDASLRGIFHCFSGSLKQAESIIELGFLMGIGGVVTFKNSGLAEVVCDIPIEYLVLETDAPFLAPHPHRGKRNDSQFIPIIAERIADVKNIKLSEVAKKTTENALALFGNSK